MLRKNLALATIVTAPSPATTGLSLVVDTGEAARFPVPATDGDFYATLFPANEIPHIGNSEIVKVTAVSSDTFTIVRAQRGSTAKTVEAGWLMIQGIYAEDLMNIQTDSLKLASGATVTAVLDENDMVSDSATALATQQSIKEYVDGAIQTATDGATVTFDLGNGAYRKHKVTLGGNRTLALSNVKVGQVFLIDLIQDATGSRTVTWFSTIKWVDGAAPTLTTTANKIDTFGFICTSEGNYQGYVVGQNI